MVLSAVEAEAVADKRIKTMKQDLLKSTVRNASTGIATSLGSRYVTKQLMQSMTINAYREKHPESTLTDKEIIEMLDSKNKKKK